MKRRLKDGDSSPGSRGGRPRWAQIVTWNHAVPETIPINTPLPINFVLEPLLRSLRNSLS
eukprot:5196815-Amphidinium_carterae.1